MRLLNLGCGAVRQGEPWTNLDELYAHLPEGTPERLNLQNEANYVDFKIGSGPLPFEDETFSGIACSHVIEHFDAIEGLKVMQECHRILKPGGHLVVSVPDCSYFKSVIDRDNIENAVELFGEPIHLPDGHTTFFDYALWMRQHKAILNEDSLWCYFKRAGFAKDRIFPMKFYKELKGLCIHQTDALDKMVPLLNRLKFSVVLVGEKG
jgi:predicted SAM-dependent methyltransferase